MGSSPTAEILFEPPAAFRQRRWLHLLLLAATLLTTTVVGGRYALDFSLNQPPFSGGYFEGLAEVLSRPAWLLGGFPFSLTLLGILMSHEMGHYLACVHYGVDASWPYFLPVPTPIGTMGAFIRIRTPIYTKAALFDIGIAGPLAGFLVLLPALGIGLAYSKVIPGIAGQGFLVFGTPLVAFPLQAAIPLRQDSCRVGPPTTGFATSSPAVACANRVSWPAPITVCT